MVLEAAQQQEEQGRNISVAKQQDFEKQGAKDSLVLLRFPASTAAGR